MKRSVGIIKLAVTALGTMCILVACVCGFIYQQFQTPAIKERVFAEAVPPLEVADAEDNKVYPAPGGLRYMDIRIGDGQVPRAGNTVSTNYVGRIRNGKVFDSSYVRNVPFTYQYGTGMVIKGWDLGIATMRVGGKRRIWIPPDLGYGKLGIPKTIPPNAVLEFDIELLSVEPAR